MLGPLNPSGSRARPGHPARPGHSARRALTLCALLLAVGCGASVLNAQQARGDEVATDRYPRVPLALLDAEQRQRFVAIAEDEICPCEGEMRSLDACLQRPDAGCALAAQSSLLGMRRLKEGEDDDSVRDAMIQMVERARQVHAFDLAQTPHKGADPGQARVVIVEFADFQCPFCARASQAVGELVDDHPDAVTVYFKQFPLGMHEHAELAARASLAAHRQGKFWALHDAMMANQQQLNPDFITQLAVDAGLDRQRFLDDLDDPRVGLQVDADRKEGDAAELTGTPTFFVDGVRFEGSLEELRALVESRIE